MRLSDTIAIWNYTCASAVKTERVKELEVKALSWIIQVGIHLMVKGFLNNYALKGAIAYSKCIHDIDHRAIMGSAWAKAAGIEKQQEWAGIALDQSAVDILSDEIKKSAQVLLADVPCKKSTVQHWVIDWRHHPDLNEDYIASTFDNIPKSKEFSIENRKKEETLKFYRAR